jgi:hypothetical protein
MQNRIIIPIHSFSSIITNSSSESFVCASKETVNAVKGLLSVFLQSSGSPHKVDEVFFVALAQLQYNDDDEEVEVITDNPSYEGCNAPYVVIKANPGFESCQPIAENLKKVIDSIDSETFCC